MPARVPLCTRNRPTPYRGSQPLVKRPYPLSNPQVRGLEGLHDRHASESAWCFGKGPGLDTFDMDEAGPLRICVNESVLVVPEPTYAIALDSWLVEAMTVKWPVGCKLVCPAGVRPTALRRGLTEGQVFPYIPRHDHRTRLELAEDPGAMSGHHWLGAGTCTAVTVAYFCRLVGVGHATLVGFEGTGGYARSVEAVVSNEAGRYTVARRDLERALDEVHLPHQFFEKRS